MYSRWLDVKEIGYSFCAPSPFLEGNGFTKAAYYHGEGNLYKTLKSGTFASAGFGNETFIPFMDHQLIYKNPKNKVCCLVYIPYAEASIISGEIKRWAETLNLKAEVYDESWFRENTCTVIVHLPEVKIKGIEESF